MNDASLRLHYLGRTIGRLFPDPGPARPYTVLPHTAVPRRLVPRRWWHRAIGPPVPVPVGGDSVEAHLSEVFGGPVRVSFHVRPARRANRKPILEVHDGRGVLVAYVKVGDTAMTRELVRSEASALHALADMPLKTVAVPAVLHHGTWRDVEVLALSPLPEGRPVRDGDLIVSAVREIAETGRRSGRDWAWHGDFSPWNIAAGPDGRLLVWDWERFETDVPLGFDAVHHFFQRALRRMPPAVAAQATLAQAVRVLEPYGTAADEARRTVVHYLITLARRHADDGHEPLGPPQTWLNPLIDHQEVLL
ncbi:hypothetical protein SAMN05421505_112179 [Sinosporangium album]|uniref:Phosphotransferase enzyme family protein n=1 Tax=Sinosporangium album TaxID=504805 RepID=A0A1G8AIK1_9ACTN|nr:hypothetical protein [Sinosporangium album]SDH20822.1 hypothetical protein SAMN05421505_112179 [Sinosporangium album]